MMEEPLTTLNLIDKIAGECCPSLASSSRNMDPLEHRRLLRVAASTFTLNQSWWQPQPTTTKKRKGKKIELAEEESAAPENHHPKRRKLVLSDHQNDRELKKRNGLVVKDKVNDCCLGLTLGVSPVSTTMPAHDDQLKEEKKENRVAEHSGNDESFLELTVGTSDAEHCHDQRPVVHRSDPAMFNIKKKLTPSDLGQNCRLLVPKEMVENHILPYFNEDKVQRMKSEAGLGVTLFDEVRQKEYDLNFKYMNSMGSYVLNGRWKQDFAKLLKLKKNDEVGLYFDTTSASPSLKPKFHFSLLKIADPADDGAPAPPQQISLARMHST